MLIDRSQKAIPAASSSNLHRLKASRFCPFLLQNLVYRLIHHIYHVLEGTSPPSPFLLLIFATSCSKSHSLLLSPAALKHVQQRAKQWSNLMCALDQNTPPALHILNSVSFFILFYSTQAKNCPSTASYSQRHWSHRCLPGFTSVLISCLQKHNQ